MPDLVIFAAQPIVQYFCKLLWLGYLRRLNIQQLNQRLLLVIQGTPLGKISRHIPQMLLVARRATGPCAQTADQGRVHL